MLAELGVGLPDLWVAVIQTAEELAEMCGVVLLLRALFSHAERELGGINLVIGEARVDRPA